MAARQKVASLAELQNFLIQRGVVVSGRKKIELVELCELAKEVSLVFDPDGLFEDREEVEPADFYVSLENLTAHMTRNTSQNGTAVHYLWCGKGNTIFRFTDYLSITSAVKFFRPQTVIFHHRVMPKPDLYNTWIQTLQEGKHWLQLAHDPKLPCWSSLRADLPAFLRKHSGVFLLQGVIITRAPVQLDTGSVFSSSSSFPPGAERSFVSVAPGTAATSGAFLTPAGGCPSVQVYNNNPVVSRGAPCLYVNDSTAITTFPRDIMHSSAPFARVARVIFYGKAGAVAVQQLPLTDLVPRLSHFIKLKGENEFRSELTFRQFVNILSALYVGGFHRVYMHVEETPTGRWWDELRKENVTAMPIEHLPFVFRKGLRKAHLSDLYRLVMLQRHGGVYQDWDVTWVSRVNDSMLACPFVFPLDWVNREFPASFNNGILMAHTNSTFLRLFMESVEVFRGNHYLYSSNLSPYKLYEKHPETMCLGHHLQVICHEGICHPTWHKDYLVQDRQHYVPPSRPFNLHDVNAIHVTSPKQIPSVKSPEVLKNSIDLYSDFAKTALRKSGRGHLLL